MKNVVPIKAAALPAKKPVERIHTKITFQRERLIEMCTEMGTLMKLHDAEIWPNRKWGTKVKFNLGKYLIIEQQNQLAVLTARTGAGTLIGYCLEHCAIDDHYGMPASVNCGFFLRKEYRVGKSLSLRKHPAYRFLAERERMLDACKAQRRRIGVKVWLDFGPILKHFGYDPDMTQYQKIAEFED